MHERGRTSTRFDHIHDRRQLLVFKCHLSGDVLRFSTRLTHAHCDRFADVPYLVFCERPQVRRLEARQARDRAYRLDAREVLHHPDAIFAPRGFADRGYARVCDRGAGKSDFEHAGPADVADELSASSEEARIFLPAQGCADAFGGIARHW